MLIEIYSPVFKENGKERGRIKLNPGLNVIEGPDNAKNSIGKSNFLLAIDFAFGGGTYAKDKNIMDNIGNHDIFFTFKFDQLYYFSRNTGDPLSVITCDSNYKKTKYVWSLVEFTSWLQSNYNLDFTGLQFRDVVSAFFRIHGKGNYIEEQPLYSGPRDNNEKSIDRIIKLHNAYGPINQLKKEKAELDDKAKVFDKAQKYKFISTTRLNRQTYEFNIRKLDELNSELDLLTIEQQNLGVDEALIENSAKKSKLVDEKIRVEGELQNYLRRKNLLDISNEYGLCPSDADLVSLQKFFPGVDIRKIYEVERYHKQLTSILEEQFAKESNEVEELIQICKQRIDSIDIALKSVGAVGNFSKDFLDRHTKLHREIENLENQNQLFLTKNFIDTSRQKTMNRIKDIEMEILLGIQDNINLKIEELNRSFIKETKMAPRLKVKGYRSYEYGTPSDNGTGTNFKGIILYDLASLDMTNLPAIAHDSDLWKKMEDDRIDAIFRLYDSCDKQVFVAFDKVKSFSNSETQRIIEKNAILKLHSNGGELYGWSWGEQ